MLQEINCLWKTTFGKRILNIYPLGNTFGNLLWDSAFEYFCGKMPLGIFMGRCLWVYLWTGTFGYICGIIPLGIFVEICLWIYLWKDAFVWVYLWNDAFGYVCGKIP